MEGMLACTKDRLECMKAALYVYPTVAVLMDHCKAGLDCHHCIGLGRAAKLATQNLQWPYL